MEKTLDKNSQIIAENEKFMANLLHDIKSPLYSIKMGVNQHLDNELNRDIFETVSNTINYIENFLLNYNFKQGKFENKFASCNIKEVIYSKIKDYKYIFKNKNINIKMAESAENYSICNIYIFVSSVIGNIISNIAFHAKENTNAFIEIRREENCIIAEFKNYFEKDSNNFNLGLDFSQNLAKCCKIELKFQKTKSQACVYLKIPDLIF